MRPSLKDFKEKALADPEVAAEYNRLSAAYELRKQLIKIRREAGLTHLGSTSRTKANERSKQQAKYISKNILNPWT